MDQNIHLKTNRKGLSEASQEENYLLLVIKFYSIYRYKYLHFKHLKGTANVKQKGQTLGFIKVTTYYKTQSALNYSSSIPI